MSNSVTLTIKKAFSSTDQPLVTPVGTFPINPDGTLVVSVDQAEKILECFPTEFMVKKSFKLELAKKKMNEAKQAAEDAAAQVKLEERELTDGVVGPDELAEPDVPEVAEEDETAATKPKVGRPSKKK